MCSSDLDQTSFSKYLLAGPDAERALQWLCTADVAVPVGRSVYTGMLNERGTYESDVTVTRTGLDGMGQIIMGRRPVTEMGGPLKIADISGQAAMMGVPSFLFFMALISINLGFINLLPVPMLDGGHLCFYAVEAVQRRPVSPRTMEIAFRSGMFVLLTLMAFVTLNDLASLGVWRFAGHGG